MADFPSYLQQPGESSQAFAAFVMYRDLGPERSLKAVAERRAQVTAENGEAGRKGVKRASGRIVFWSKNWRWVERAEAFDREMERMTRAAWVKEIEASGRRHAKLAMMLQRKALDRLVNVDVDGWGLRDILAFIKLGIMLERQARGMDLEPRLGARHYGRIPR